MSTEKLSALSEDESGPWTSPDRPPEDAQSVAHALHELTARFRLVLENASEVILQYDASGCLLWASPSLRTTFGFDDVAVVGTHLRFEHPDDDAAVETLFQERLLAGDDVIHTRGRALCADGTVRWASSRIRVVRDGAGGIDYIVTTIRDVTAQTEAERALSASEAQYRLMAENSSDFVSLTTSEGLIAWVSPGVTSVLGWDPGELLGRRGIDGSRPWRR
jgi:PAS domain S-box-containing protein